MRLALLALLGALGCSDNTDDQIRAQVTLMLNQEGAAASAAAGRLSRYGRRAIPTIEAAMHTASPTGRKNLILALRQLGDAEAIPLLAHLARFDPSLEVQREAEWTLRQWATEPGGAPERRERARGAVRALDEDRGRQEAG
jgi:hypothetical protein